MLTPVQRWSVAYSKKKRAKRFARFERLIERVPRPFTMLDVGGTNEFWEAAGWTDRDDVRITLLNLEAAEKKYDNIDPVAGDARDLSEYSDGQFDVAFSNSVIEHLFTFENQLKMAAEMSRVGNAYWVQTPNHWFPLEPHFRVIGWQWMPVSWRIGLMLRRQCGWTPKQSDPVVARRIIEEVILPTRGMMKQLFPDGTIGREWSVGMTKSWIAMREWDPARGDNKSS